MKTNLLIEKPIKESLKLIVAILAECIYKDKVIMKKNLKHWRKKYPNQHRSYGEKRKRDFNKIKNIDRSEYVH